MAVGYEFEVDGAKYRIVDKIGPRKQLHVTRRLGPLVDVFAELQQRRISGASLTVLEAIAPIAHMMAAMPEADIDYVLDETMPIVSVQKGNAWQRVWDRTTREPMFDDLSMVQMIRIAIEVIQQELGLFLLAGLFGSTAEAGKV